MKILHFIQSFLLACVNALSLILKDFNTHFFGVLKIALIFVGVLVCLVVIVPLSPFILTYFLFDRSKKHKELMNGKVKKKSGGLSNLMSINDWANKDKAS